MAKLFALEDADLEGVGEVELEAAPEVGEVADVETEVVPEVTEVAEIESGVEEGMGAADQLDQVEEVVAQAAEGEGLEPVAAEAIKIAVEAICARIGANPKAVYSLYASENFQSASSRKANTKYALEGVAEFLKDLWKKIKAALSNLWTKVKAFWDKHVSTLGRVKKALDSMKQKVSASTGKLEKQAYVESAPSGIASAFGFGGKDVLDSSISDVIDAHVEAGKKVEEIMAMGSKAAKAAADAIAATQAIDLKNVTGEWSLGSANAPLVGGATSVFKIEVEESNVAVTLERDAVEKGEKAGVKLVEKAAVTSLLTKTMAVIDADIKAKAGFDKAQTEFTKAMADVEKAINATANDKASAEAAKPSREAVKVMYKVNSKIPQISAERVSMDIKLAKGVLGYAGLCLKNYK